MQRAPSSLATKLVCTEQSAMVSYQKYKIHFVPKINNNKQQSIN